MIASANKFNISLNQWIEDKLFDLTITFSLDGCAYAIMSNHYRIVFYIDKEQADRWDRIA